MKSGIPYIEDYEFEGRGVYIRVSVDPDAIEPSNEARALAVCQALGLCRAEPVDVDNPGQCGECERTLGHGVHHGCNVCKRWYDRCQAQQGE